MALSYTEEDLNTATDTSDAYWEDVYTEQANIAGEQKKMETETAQNDYYMGARSQDLNSYAEGQKIENSYGSSGLSGSGGEAQTLALNDTKNNQAQADLQLQMETLLQEANFAYEQSLLTARQAADAGKRGDQAALEKYYNQWLQNEENQKAAQDQYEATKSFYDKQYEGY